MYTPQQPQPHHGVARPDPPLERHGAPTAPLRDRPVQDLIGDLAQLEDIFRAASAPDCSSLTDRWALAVAALADARALLGAGSRPRKPRSAHATTPSAQHTCAELTRAALTALRTLDPGELPPLQALDAFRTALVALEWLEQQPVAP